VCVCVCVCVRVCGGGILTHFHTSIKHSFIKIRYMLCFDCSLLLLLLLLQMVSKIIPFMSESAPLVPVRVVECILGRVSSSHFLVVFPAHFLGSIVGIVVFQYICPEFLIEVSD
jgi:hypothetical protein